MKKKILVGLTTGLFMVVLVGLAQAAPDNNSNDVYYDNNTAVGSEFGEYEVRADMKTLKKLLRAKALREKALKAIPAAGPSHDEDHLSVEAKNLH